MAILYVAVFKGLRTGAEYAACKSDVAAVAKQQYLPTVARMAGKYCFLHQGHTFSFLTSSGTTYVCVAVESFGRLLPAAFLERLAQDWARWSAEAGGKLDMLEQEGQWTATYSKSLKSLVDEVLAHPENFSKIHDVQLKVDRVKEVALQNVQVLIARQDQIERIEDQTTDLLAEAKTFSCASKRVCSRFWWQSFRMKLLMAAAALLLVALVFLVVCFGAAHCFDR